MQPAIAKDPSRPRPPRRDAGGSPARTARCAASRRGGAIALLACLLVSAASFRAAAEDASSPSELGEETVFSVGPLQYRPGRGLKVGSTGLVIGGFTNIKAERSEATGGEFSVDALNIFLIYDHSPRFRAVAELQMRDLFVADEDGASVRDFAFDVRRLFGDFRLSDQLQLRAGTFLTPVGYWNEILAPPLTWTTEAPLIAEETFFQQTTTGLMLHGSTPVAQGRLGYSLFSQFLKPLEDDPDLDPPAHTAGARLEYGVGPSWSIGATYQAAQNHGLWSHLGSLHALWQFQRGEILGEFIYQDGEELSSSQWGTYLQGVLTVREPFYVVGRYEHFEQPSPDPPLNLWVLGVVCKPFPFMALKVEYRLADRNPEDDPAGLFASFTTFF